MQYVPPELRSGLDEIDLALAGKIPELVDSGDMRGDFHMHTDWSDGRDSLEAMIAAAASRGYQYHAISDHSRGQARRYGMDALKLREQRGEIAALGDRYGIRTLCCSEVDILPDGSLDLDDATLAELDVVIASVHVATHQSREEMTARLIRACENPLRYHYRPSHRPPLRLLERLRVRLRRGLCRRRANRNGPRN